MKGYAILVIVLISGALICGCTSVPSSPKETSPATQITTTAPTGPTVTVSIKARAFDPATITINKGTTVTWINEDPVSHHVVHYPKVTNEELFDSGPLSFGESYSYTFLEKGRYEYGDPQIGGGESQHPVVIVE